MFLSQCLVGLLEKTHFSMAQQDVRYYLNGLLLETGGTGLRAVATDGHRLALCEDSLDGGKASEKQVIVPAERRVGVTAPDGRRRRYRN